MRLDKIERKADATHRGVRRRTMGEVERFCRNGLLENQCN